MKAQDFLKAGLGHMQDRAATYDKPTGERSMAATVGAFKCVSGVEMTEEQGWLFMGILKMVRSQQGEFKADNYEDEAAYAALRGECAFAARSGDTASPVAKANDDMFKDAPEWADCILESLGVREFGITEADGVYDDLPENCDRARFLLAGDPKFDTENPWSIIAYRIHKAGE